MQAGRIAIVSGRDAGISSFERTNMCTQWLAVNAGAEGGCGTQNVTNWSLSLFGVAVRYSSSTPFLPI